MAKIFVLSLVGAAVLGLTACATLSSGQSLTGRVWILTELNGRPPVQGTTISAEFREDNRVSGTAGCNNYNTSYTVDGSSLTFSDPAAATLMACAEPVMIQEQAYFQALAATASFELRDDRMTWLDADGNSLAEFESQSQDLAGTSWTVISYNTGQAAVVSLISGTEITADFAEDGQLGGSAGCNTYFASYETEGNSIRIGAPGSTRMFCAEPEGLMEQESQYLAALQTAATYRIEGSTMEMRTADGALAAMFSRALPQ
ncbi:MAG TPA: META domain-containing protein [Anaerolineales bacterium]|nr:META domain-containing protein [Anaerolineales bacterium]